VAIPIILLLLLASPGRALARGACSPPDLNGVQECVAGVTFSQAIGVADRQHMDEWCWAATVSMLFRYYNHRVSQENVVRFAYGQLVDMPGQPGQLTAALNRVWQDDDGRRFYRCALS
jgi:hypothetical protein